MNARLLSLAASPLLLLVACGDDAGTNGVEDTRQASGEVLEGTISDAMLPLDEVRSQAPLAGPPPGASSDSSDPLAETDESEAELQGDSAEAVPAAEPASATPGE